MAAGLGYKEFTTGDVLTAADANGYLASQVVMVFADAAARTSAIASPQEGMIAYLKDTNAVEKYDGAAWVSVGGGGGGKVLQVVSTTKSDTFTTSSTSFTDVTGLSVSITPSAATSKVLVLYNMSAGQSAGHIAHSRLMRDSTAINIGNTAGSRNRSTSDALAIGTASVGTTIAGSFLDSPATTAATTYKMQGAVLSPGTLFVNRTEDDSDNANRSRTVSTITVMEIGA
jgi:hypothetical protein